MNSIVGLNRVNLLLPLEFCDRQLRDQDLIVQNLCRGLHPPELTRPKYIAGIRERRSDANRTRLSIQLPVNKCHMAFVRIHLSIRKRERQGNLGSSMKQIAARAGSLRQRKILAIADRKINLDRIK